MRRRLLIVGAAGWAVLQLAGCAASSSPPTRWYELRGDPPLPAPSNATAATATTATAGDGDIWEVASVRLPGALDRDALMVASGAAGLQALAGHRWAEPLRDAVPRLLVHDLSRLRGAGRVWAAPVPEGVAVARRLRVDVQVLQGGEDRRSVRLAAQWWLLDARPDAGTAPQSGSADFEVPLTDPSIDALAAAHRAALWQLAERIARLG